MMKKVSAWFLALFLAGGMAACNAPQGSKGKEDQTTEESPAPASEEKEASQEQSEKSGEEHPAGGSEHPSGGGSEHPN
jgi:ABC-type glycerol-3-phosphate transport system substrate-binding protein